MTVWLLTRKSDPKRLALSKVSNFWGSLYFRSNPLWRVTITGREKIDPDETVIFVCNHQSSFDIYLIFMLFLPVHWVTKRSNFKIPLIGWHMQFMRSIGFERGDRRETLMMVKECVKRLDEGVSLMIFPEGERAIDGRMKPFLGGAFAIAKRAKVPIQPLVLTGTYAIQPRGTPLVNPASNVTLTVLDLIPLDVVESKSADELSELAWQQMAAALPPEALPLPEEG
jgi:1-acyl-sn-glycerol-3-phosphate acyltransferase